jgi:hypothetical protein
MIKFGRAKKYGKIKLKDYLKYPIWTSTHDERHDEETEKPIINISEVTLEIINDPLIVPIFAIKDEKTNIPGTAWYLHDEQKLIAISIWYNDQWTTVSEVEEFSFPIIFVALPKILGIENVKFKYSDTDQDQAIKIS